jgi:hypothetical protein
MPTVADPELRESYIDIYEAIRQAWLQHDIGPTLVEISYATGYSLQTVRMARRVLNKRGHVTHQPYKERSTRPTDLSRKLSLKPVAPWDEDLDTPQIWL